MATQQAHLRGEDLFRKIVISWRRRSDPTEGLTLNQIANIAFGKGSSENAAIVGRTISGDFGAYFKPPTGPGRKFRVNWASVERDHPELLQMPGKRKSDEVSPASAVDEMEKALNDEIREVRKEAEARPVKCIASALWHETGDGTFLYEAIVELPGDSELAIPEGVGMILRWKYLSPYMIDATLLSYSPQENKIIYETQRPLPKSHETTQAVILPKIEELLKAVQTRLRMLNADRGALSWRLLDRNLKPRITAAPFDIAGQGLDEAQRQSIRTALGQDITLLWGPPGTGKTYTLGRLITEDALRGGKIVATGIANVAVDQIARSVVAALEAFGERGNALLNEGRVVRFGYARLPEITDEPRLFPNKDEAQRLRKLLHDERLRRNTIPVTATEARALSQKKINDLSERLRNLTKEVIERASVVLTTAVQTCLEPSFSQVEFSTSVIDEASMMPIPYLACTGMLGRSRLIVAGDFRQLGPIALSKSSAALRWLHRDCFSLQDIDQNSTHPSLSMLTLQRRMHPSICELINEPFYGNKLRTADIKGLRGVEALEPLPGQPVVLVLLTSEDGSTVQTTDAGSRYNEISAALVANLAASYVRQTSSLNIGVITPYRAQVQKIKRLIEDSEAANELTKRIKVGTVHAFQGSESDVILWDLVDAQGSKVGRLYQEDAGNRLVNVAISRAKHKLIIVGDPDVFSKSPGSEMVRSFRYILTKHFSNGRNTVAANELWSTRRLRKMTR